MSIAHIGKIIPSPKNLIPGIQTHILIFTRVIVYLQVQPAISMCLERNTDLGSMDDPPSNKYKPNSIRLNSNNNSQHPSSEEEKGTHQTRQHTMSTSQIHRLSF